MALRPLLLSFGAAALLLSSCRFGFEELGLGDAAGAGGLGGDRSDVEPPATGGESSEVGAGGSAPSDGGASGGPGVGGEGTGGAPREPVAVVAVTLTAGQTHTCAISATETLSCWGLNDNSALGGFVGTQSSEPAAVAWPDEAGKPVSVQAGQGVSCAVSEFGDVYCWGAGEEGTLGQGNTEDSAVPLQVPLPEPVVQISLSYRVACAVDVEEDVYCWGENTEGQAGQGDLVEAPVSAASPLKVPLSGNYAEVAAGHGHVCAVRKDGALFCWGRNSASELGFAAPPVQMRSPTRVGTESDFLSVRTGQSQTCARRGTGTLWCFGQNSGSQLGLSSIGVVTVPTQVESESDWTAVEVDVLHGCGLRGTGSLYCWGRREEGQLTLSYDPTPVPSPLLIGVESDWTDLTVGRFHTCARRQGLTFCTGANDDGRIGDGTLTRPYGFVEVLPH